MRPQPASARSEASSASRSSPPAPLAARPQTSRALRPRPLRRNAAHVLQDGLRRSCEPALEHGATATSCGNIHFTSIRRSPLNATPSHSRCSSSARHREITLSNSSRVDAMSGDVVTAQLTLLRACDRRSVSTIDVGSIQNTACASSSKNTTARLARGRPGLPGQFGAIEPALQAGQGVSPPQQVQPLEPPNGRSGCLSQTQPMPLHDGHVMDILPWRRCRS